MERFLKPVRESQVDYASLEKYILELLRSNIYKPLANILKLRLIKNAAQSDIVNAILLGSIRYVDTGFEGKFSANVSKTLHELGGKYNKKLGKWEIPRSKLTSDILQALYEQRLKDENLKQKISSKLGEITSENVTEKLKTDTYFKSVISNIEKQFQGSIKDILIAPDLSDEIKKRLASEYTENLGKYIKEFAEKEILSLRKQVVTHTFKGNRYDDLAKYIQDSYGVSTRKAKFLARQETNLLAAKLKETRYQDAGIDDYEWRTVAGSPASPVRPMHKQLNRTRQKFSNPPVTDKYGNKNNPKEDYNCRCFAMPLVKF